MQGLTSMIEYLAILLRVFHIYPKKTMKIELQNKVWSILPKEFKEEVKEIYSNVITYHPCGYNHKTDLLKYLFGRHNLTSDSEGEEILTVPRKKVQRAYNTSREIVKAENPDSLMYSMHTQIMCVLENIFGSKCLPDAHEDNFTTKEPQPAEPKNEGTRQEQCVPKNAESGTHSFNHTLKDDFRNERRLNIAAQILGGIVASGKPCRQPVKRALEIADALIAECEKKGGHDGEA